MNISYQQKGDKKECEAGSRLQIKNCTVEELSVFTSFALAVSAEGVVVLTENTFIDDFKVLFQISEDNRTILTSWNSDSGFTVATSDSIAGEYICLGTNPSGGLGINVSISIVEINTQITSSIIYIRVISNDVIPVANRQFQLAVGESFILESIAVEREGIQLVFCIDVPNSDFPNLSRIECQIIENPQRQSTILVGEEVIQLLESESIAVQGYSNSSITGFCDYEQTSNSAFGNYTWPETLGGESVSQPCANNGNSANDVAIRRCIGFTMGWNALIDFSNCRDITTLPIPFVFYLRFSTDFNNISSQNPEIAVDTLRIAIELSVAVTAQCIVVPVDRVECRINGTVDSESRLEAIEETIVANLTQLNYLVPASNISNVDGFCNMESTVNTTGTLLWNETIVNATDTTPCPFGPPNATATRQCIARLNWSSPNTTECASVVTQAFQGLLETLDEIDDDNVAAFTSNLTELVNISVAIPDQSEQNTRAVTDVLVRTAEIIFLPTITLPVTQIITIDVVNIVDDVEEWPAGSIQALSTVIIQAFENITIALVTQENFTNLTVVTEDVVLVAERVNANELLQMGRTFTASGNNGALQVISDADNNQTNQDLQNNQIATLTFPSGINVRQLIGATDDDEDVGIFFAIYNEPQSPLFPSDRVNIQSNNITQDVVGSAVVSFTIARLPPGTILPVPLLIDLRVSDPDTGSSENITNATCVFYNFQISDWDPTGCETVYDPRINPNEVTCRCTHLTNFACLVDISSRVDGGAELTRAQTTSLEVVSYIGVTLSLIGLFLTFITLLIFKQIRQRDVTKFHLQLCLSLTFMYIVFVSGIDKTDIREGCVTVGVLIHYFSLVSWMWMGAEAVLMFQKLIIIFGHTTWKYMLFVSIVCWTVPIVTVIIPVGIDPDFYITSYDDNTTRSGFCFISNVGVFFGGFLGPILLVIIFNTVIYSLVIRVLIKHNLQKNKHKLDKTSLSAVEAFKLVLSICGIMFLFGLTWIFAIFTFVSTNRDAAFALQFIFALFNALQGFWIFFFFVLLNSEARQSWTKLLFPCKQNNENAPSTSKTDISAKTKYFTASKPRSSVSTDSTVDGMDTLKSNMYKANKRKFSSDLVVTNSTVILEEEEEEEGSGSPDIIFDETVYPQEKNGLKKEDEIQMNDNKKEVDFMIRKARVQRHSTKIKREHHVEQIELDFFSDDDDDDNDFFNN